MRCPPLENRRGDECRRHACSGRAVLSTIIRSPAGFRDQTAASGAIFFGQSCDDSVRPWRLNAVKTDAPNPAHHLSGNRAPKHRSGNGQQLQRVLARNTRPRA